MSNGSKEAKVKRVAFILEVQDWLGGINYYRSLLSALALVPEPKLLPVMFAGTNASESLTKNFGCVKVVRTKILETRTPAGLVRRALRKILGQRDVMLEALLRWHRIDVLSHYSGMLSRGTTIRTIGWIPDFQYIHLPELFTKVDQKMREQAVNRLTGNCERIVLSSKAAQRDLAGIAPRAVGISRVLHFVPQVDVCSNFASISELENKYGFQRPYFYLPNQFWAHKNHRIVIEALALLKSSGKNPTVLATGNNYDHRFPGHFAELMAQVHRHGLEGSFLVLGVVPYHDLLSLMGHALAVINPSLCEGWSTTVEESKALGKTVLLSDIPVHREQNPEKGIFFDPRNASELADRMASVWEPDAAPGNDVLRPVYSRSYRQDRLNFAASYQDLVTELCANPK